MSPEESGTTKNSTMPPMPVLRTLTGWLHSHGKTQTEINRYELRFSQLRDAEPTPCPVCFLEAPANEAEQSLILLGRVGIEAPLFCPGCRTMFQIPVEYVPLS